VAEHIDPVVTLHRGARLSRRNSGEHDFVTPPLPTPVIARPTVWTGSQRSAEEILAALDELETDTARKERSRRVLGVRHLLSWLAASRARRGSSGGSPPAQTPLARHGPTCQTRTA
jgi:hypothetical protein